MCVVQNTHKPEGRVWEGILGTGDSLGVEILIMLFFNNNDSSTWFAEHNTKHFACIISFTAFL